MNNYLWVYMKEELELKISAIKETISASPVNNIKNLNKKLEELKEIEKEYSEQLDTVKTKINNYTKKYENLTINPDIEETYKEIQSVKNKISLTNPLNTSFEKLGLDLICYNIRNHKDNDLEYINKNILDAIDIFKKVGVKIEPNSFTYSVFLYEYMFNLLTGMTLDELKEIFENIYWKCPNIISHIEINIKNLYLKNIKSFEKYIKEQEKDLNIDKLITKYSDLKMSYIKMLNTDEYTNLNKFKNKEYKINDFTEEKIEKIKYQFSNDLNSPFNKLLDDLIEYQNYNKFSFILDDIKVKFSEKDKYKNNYKTILKEIIKMEKSLNKLTKKYFKLKDENKLSELQLKINSSIDEIYLKYMELEEAKFNEQVYKNVFNESAILSIFKLASAYPTYLYKLKEDINIDELIEYILSPYNTIITNANISTTYDFPHLISEKNKLMNLNVNSDLLNESSIDGLINQLKLILIFDDLKKMSIKIEEIESYLNIINVLG